MCSVSPTLSCDLATYTRDDPPPPPRTQRPDPLLERSGFPQYHVVLSPSPSGDLSTFCPQMLFLATFFPTWEGGIYDFIGVSCTREGPGVRVWVPPRPLWFLTQVST